MITKEDLQELDNWSRSGETAFRVREWHSQLIVELIEYIRLLENNLREVNTKLIDLEEEIRFKQPLEFGED